MSDFDKNEGFLQPAEQYKPSVKFIQIRHSDNDAPNVWLEAKKNDVILLEVGDLTIHEREARETGANSVASLEDPTERKRKLGNAYSDGSFLSQIMKGAILEGKEIHFVDIPENHDTNKTQNEELSYLQKSYDCFFEADFKGSLLHLRNYILADGESGQLREKIVVSQIENLLQKNQTKWKNKSVCVIQGMNHVKSYHIFKNRNPGVSSSRTFLNGKRFSFLLEHEARQRLNAGSKEDQKLSIERLFISRLILPALITDENINEKNKKTDELARMIGRDEINTIFKKLTEIRRDVKSELHMNNPEYIKAYINKRVELLAQQILEQHPLSQKI